MTLRLVEWVISIGQELQQQPRQGKITNALKKAP
jgi:hypothetical protein